MTLAMRRPALFLVAAATALGVAWAIPRTAFADQFIYSVTYSGTASGTFYFEHCDEDEFGGGCFDFPLNWTASGEATYDLYFNANGFYWISWIYDQMGTCIQDAVNAGLPMDVYAGAQNNHYEWDTNYVESAYTANSIQSVHPSSSVCVLGWQAVHDDYHDPVNETENGGWTSDPRTYQSASWTLANFDVGNG